LLAKLRVSLFLNSGRVFFDLRTPHLCFSLRIFHNALPQLGYLDFHLRLAAQLPADQRDDKNK
jgi:hypothetical protein